MMFRLLAAAVLAAAAPASATVLDFEDLSTGTQANGFVEQGYSFTNAYGRDFAVITTSGSKAIFPPGFSSQPPYFPPSFSMARVDGAAFALKSLVVYTADSNGLGVPISFVGTTTGGATVFYYAMTPEYDHSLPVAGTRTVITLPSTFTGLTKVSWAQGAEYHQFDDVEVLAAGVPEPTGWALMLAGFAGLGGMARRRRMVLAWRQAALDFS